MKKLITRIFEIDKKMLKTSNKINNTFLGKVLLKIISETFLAILIAVAIYASRTLYEDASRLTKDNLHYENLTIGLSEEYVNSLFGIPKSTLYDGSIKNNFYKMKDSILRVCFDSKDTSIAYFITVTKSNRTISISLYYQDINIKLGKSTFDDIDMLPIKIDANVAGSGDEYNYYAEWFYMGNPGGYNTYIYSINSYGISNELDTKLTGDAYFNYYLENGKVELENIKQYRYEAKPNTFGVIAFGYEDLIDVVPYNDRWKDVCRTLR